MPIRVVAKVQLANSVVKATQEHWLEFNVVFQPDCTKDTIYFNIPADFGAIPYYLTSPVATQKILNPVYTQYIPECPVVCDLFENLQKWDASNPLTIVQDFNTVTGAIKLLSNDITKDNSQTLLVLECISIESEITSSVGAPDNRDGCDFEINLFDACALANISPPQMQYSLIETELFEIRTTNFSPATSNGSDCSMFTYTLLSENGSLTAPSFYVNNLSVRS